MSQVNILGMLSYTGTAGKKNRVSIVHSLGILEQIIGSKRYSNLLLVLRNIVIGRIDSLLKI